jgi:hypothetical protein
MAEGRVGEKRDGKAKGRHAMEGRADKGREERVGKDETVKNEAAGTKWAAKDTENRPNRRANNDSTAETVELTETRGRASGKLMARVYLFFVLYYYLFSLTRVFPLFCFVYMMANKLQVAEEQQLEAASGWRVAAGSQDGQQGTAEV